MTMSHSQSHPYAKAIFEIALADNTLSEWSALLNAMEMLVSDHSVQMLFNNPNVSRQQLAAFFIDMVSALNPAWVQTKAKLFIQLLAEYRRMNLIPSIAFAFKQLLAEHENVLNAQVTSAYPLNEKSENDLMQALKKRFGRDVNLTYDTDTNLIGGVVIRVGDLVIDGSIRDKLIRLKGHLSLLEVLDLDKSQGFREAQFIDNK